MSIESYRNPSREGEWSSFEAETTEMCTYQQIMQMFEKNKLQKQDDLNFNISEVNDIYFLHLRFFFKFKPKL